MAREHKGAVPGICELRAWYQDLMILAPRCGALLDLGADQNGIGRRCHLQSTGHRDGVAHYAVRGRTIARRGGDYLASVQAYAEIKLQATLLSDLVAKG
jgi:hypothetical protein